MFAFQSHLLVAIACSCLVYLPASVQVMEELAFSDIVFRGQVVSENNRAGQATFTVLQSWKGRIKGQITVNNYYGCDGVFKTGKEYVVFMRYQADRGFSVASCAGFTREIQDPGADYALNWLVSNSLLTKLLLLLTKRRIRILMSVIVLGLVGFVWLKFFRAGV